MHFIDMKEILLSKKTITVLSVYLSVYFVLVPCVCGFIGIL